MEEKWTPRRACGGGGGGVGRGAGESDVAVVTTSLDRDGAGEAPHSTAAVSRAIPPQGQTPSSGVVPWFPQQPFWTHV